MIDFFPNVRHCAVVGSAKNVGKTTTIQWLIDQAQERGKKIGLASMGVDGESIDVWDGHEKPAINLPEGSFVATAKGVLSESSAKFRLLQALKASSPLGPVYLMQCIQAGDVKLAGTHRNQDLMPFKKVCQEMDVDLILIDGAYDRLAASNGEIVDGFILCTGASFHSQLDVCVQKTEDILIKWSLPVWEGSSPPDTNVAYMQNGQWQSTTYQSALVHVDPLRLLSHDVQALYIPGALSEWLMGQFSSVKQPFTWVVDDPTSIFLNKETVLSWLRRGGDICVRHRSQLLALSVNPFSTHGDQDAERWMTAMKDMAGDLPVLDAKRRICI